MTHQDVSLHGHGDRQPGGHTQRHVEDEVAVGVQVPVAQVPQGRGRVHEDDHQEVEDVVEELDGVSHGQRAKEGVGGSQHIPPGQNVHAESVAQQAWETDARVNEHPGYQLAQKVKNILLNQKKKKIEQKDYFNFT